MFAAAARPCGAETGPGASSGRRPAPQRMRPGLPRDFAFPARFAQHVICTLLPGMVERADQTTGSRAHVEAHCALLAELARKVQHAGGIES